MKTTSIKFARVRVVVIALAFFSGLTTAQATSAASESFIMDIATNARSVVRLSAFFIRANASGGGAFNPQASIVKVWGFNASGQLGLGSTISPQRTPQTLSGVDDVTAFDGGLDHSAALRSDGTVITAGGDAYGQLGDGTVGGNRSFFSAVIGGDAVNVIQISGGGFHTLALRADGTVWAWGINDVGELGNGGGANSAAPVRVGAGIVGFEGRVVQVSAGAFHNLALTDDGKVWAWGYNSNNQLGDGTQTDRHLPVPVLTAAGGAQLSGILQISAGERHSVALTGGGAVLVWGSNVNGQIGNDTINTEGCQCVKFPTQTINGLMGTVVSVGAGSFHNVALNTFGDVYAWGAGSLGQIGDGNQSNALAPRKTAVVANIVRIEADLAYHSLARRRDGTLFAWGNNSNGEIGDGSPNNQFTPLDISAPTGAGGGNLGTNVTVFGAGIFQDFASTASEGATPAGASVFRGEEFSVGFPDSTVGGTTQIRAFDPATIGLSVPANYTILANSIGYDITTTATFSGAAATVCLKVPTVIDQLAFNRLYILHDDNGDGALDAVNVTRDYQRREICRPTASFSSFVLASGSAPTAAAVSISGRVITPQGLGLTDALVTLTDAGGNARTVATGRRGAFRFMEVAAGETYILSVRAKRYIFAARVVTPNEDMTGLDFTAR